MLPALALGALSFGGSLLSGIGNSQASAKQARLQSMADDRARILNQEQLNIVNAARDRLGRELLDTPEETYTSSTSNSASDTQNRSWVDTDAMMAAAERSGFNPVTWLNAGGMQAYTQSSSSTINSSEITNYEWKKGHNAADAYKLMVPEYALQQASQVPQQHSALSAFGGALSAGANAFGTQYRADQSLDLQAQRLAAMAGGNIQTGMGLSNGNGLMTALMQPGTAPRGGTNVAGGLGSETRSKDEDVYWPGYEQAAPQLWEGKKPESTNPFPPSWGWTVPPGYANAETWEDSFGEPVSWPYGVWKFGNTLAHNLTGATLPTGVQNYWNTGNWSGEIKPTTSVSPYVPSGMPAHLAYPSWARP